MRKQRFTNPHISDAKRTLKDALLWKIGHFDDPEDLPPMPPHFVPSLLPEPLNKDLPSALWVNHSTFFLKIDGVHFLTDPVWGKRCSPIAFLGPVRRHTATLELKDLEKVDHVLISHNHYDHLEKKTVLELHKLYPNIQWWVPLGVKKWFTKLGIKKVQELGWWESASFDGFKITGVPSQHFAGRNLWDTWNTLWLGWVVESKTKRFYFVGDTGYNPFDFKSIGEKWSHMDLSLIPIGSYTPRKFMGPVHIDPAQAVEIHKEVSSIRSIAMHWGTFNLSDEERFRPPYDLLVALQKEGIDPLTFLAIPPGHEINW